MAGNKPVGTDQGSDRVVENNQVHDNAANVCRAEVASTPASDQRTAINAMTQPGDAAATQKFDGDNPPVIVNAAGGTAGGDTVQTVKTTETTDAYVKVNRWDDPTLPTWGVDREALHHVGSVETTTTTTVARPAEGSPEGGGTSDATSGLRTDAAPGRVADLFGDKDADKDGDGVRDDEQAGKDGKTKLDADGKEGGKEGKEGKEGAKLAGKDAADADSDGDGVSDRDEDIIGAAAGASDAAAATGRKGRNGSRNVRRQEAEQAQVAVGSDEELEKTKVG